MSEGTEPMTMDCHRHGRQVAAVVCQHQVQGRDHAVGFVENSSDPDDLQAWCDRCEARFLAEGGMTEEFRHFNGMTVVCVPCYDELKGRHGPRASDNRS